MIMYLARDIPAFVMYCVYGASCSSLLIESVESTDSMIRIKIIFDGDISCIYSMALSGSFDVARTIYKRYTSQPQFI